MCFLLAVCLHACRAGRLEASKLASIPVAESKGAYRLTGFGEQSIEERCTFRERLGYRR